MKPSGWIISSAATMALLAIPAAVKSTPITLLFSTGNPNGLIATVSRPASPGVETETADDFILGQNALVTGATFTGLLPVGASLSSVQDVEIELYHIFPLDSANPPSGNVPTRTNSPSDIQFMAFNSAAGDISVTASVVAANFTALNSVVNGINKSPNQTTGGEGSVTGEEVLFTVVFNIPFLVGATDHDFFRPEVQLSSGNFLWLSAPKPIVAPGTPVAPDLQAWIRNSNLSPDWLRIGTDIVGGTPPPTYNMTFSLSGQPVATTPEPPTVVLFGVGLTLILIKVKSA